MKLLLAAPCNLVSIDQQLGHSLIGVFHDIAVKVPPDTEIPANALLPKEWAVFSKWLLSPGEEGEEYFLVSEIYWPDGTMLNQIKVKAPDPNANSITFVLRNQAFPFGQNGKVKILIWIEKEDGEGIKLVHESIEILISTKIEKDLEMP